MEPARRDLTLFLARMEIADALLPRLEDGLLLRWAHTLVIELAALSARFPHEGGKPKRVQTSVA